MVSNLILSVSNAKYQAVSPSFYDFTFAHKKDSVYISTSFFLWLMTFIRLVLVIRDSDEPETTIEKEKVCFF